MSSPSPPAPLSHTTSHKAAAFLAQPPSSDIDTEIEFLQQVGQMSHLKRLPALGFKYGVGGASPTTDFRAWFGERLNALARGQPVAPDPSFDQTRRIIGLFHWYGGSEAASSGLYLSMRAHAVWLHLLKRCEAFAASKAIPLHWVDMAHEVEPLEDKRRQFILCLIQAYNARLVGQYSEAFTQYRKAWKLKAGIWPKGEYPPDVLVFMRKVKKKEYEEDVPAFPGGGGAGSVSAEEKAITKLASSPLFVQGIAPF